MPEDEEDGDGRRKGSLFWVWIAQTNGASCQHAGSSWPRDRFTRLQLTKFQLMAAGERESRDRVLCRNSKLSLLITHLGSNLPPWSSSDYGWVLLTYNADSKRD